MNQLQSLVQRILEYRESAGVLATLVTVAGSSYRRPGARMLLGADGRRSGLISGGCLEEDISSHAQSVARSGEPKVITYDTTSENDLVWGVGLGCHGVVQVLLERLPPQPKWAIALAANLRDQTQTDLSIVWKSAGSEPLGTYLQNEIDRRSAVTGVFDQTIEPPTPLVIFGAGDDSQPLARLAKEVGWHVTVADPRREFATPARFPAADTVLVAPSSELVASVRRNNNTVAVVMTHHYVHDLPILRDLLALDLRYVGLLGPKKRAERIIADVAKAGVILNAAKLARLHAPVGLDTGAETPEEVALSIVAEISATLAGRDARPLRERHRPIHE